MSAVPSRALCYARVTARLFHFFENCMSGLANFAKRGVNSLPSPLRFAAFIASRGMARQVVPRYRRSANIYATVGGSDLKIHAGPFRGVKYISCATGSTTLPKLLGTYELELHDAVEKFCSIQPDVIVDIGSAEGYYAVGMAVRLPQAKVICYDIDPYARYLLHRLAARNGVTDRVMQKEACDPRELETVLSPARKPVLIIDVDGPEDQLLRPDQTPSLARTWIIVELHDFLNAGVSQRIRERFESTHEIVVVNSLDRTVADLPAGVELSAQDAIEAMNEARPAAQQWFVMTPKN
jgi:hypothetical protein